MCLSVSDPHTSTLQEYCNKITFDRILYFWTLCPLLCTECDMFRDEDICLPAAYIYRVHLKSHGLMRIAFYVMKKQCA